MDYYRAKKITWGGISFDSEFEFKVFNTLRTYFGTASIKVHVPLVVRPETAWFPEQLWKIDYVVRIPPESLSNDSSLYIECKGIIQEDFKEKMKNLSYFRPDVFENLVVIAPKVQTIVRGFGTLDLYALEGFLDKEDISGLVNCCKKRRESDV